MTRSSPPAIPLPPEADKPRMVIDYGGLQIWDARHDIRVVLKGEPPRGVKGCLRVEGFRQVRDGVWTRPNTPDAIFTAQHIGATFFTTDK